MPKGYVPFGTPGLVHGRRAASSSIPAHRQPPDMRGRFPQRKLQSPPRCPMPHHGKHPDPRSTSPATRTAWALAQVKPHYKTGALRQQVKRQHNRKARLAEREYKPAAQKTASHLSRPSQKRAFERRPLIRSAAPKTSLDGCTAYKSSM